MTLSELWKNTQSWLSLGLDNLSNGNIGELTIGQGVFTLFLAFCCLILCVRAARNWNEDYRHNANLKKREIEKWNENNPTIAKQWKESPPMNQPAKNNSKARYEGR
jgi:hypothetical protein